MEGTGEAETEFLIKTSTVADWSWTKWRRLVKMGGILRGRAYGIQTRASTKWFVKSKVSVITVRHFSSPSCICRRDWWARAKTRTLLVLLWSTNRALSHRWRTQTHSDHHPRTWHIMDQVRVPTPTHPTEGGSVLLWIPRRFKLWMRSNRGRYKQQKKPIKRPRLHRFHID